MRARLVPIAAAVPVAPGVLRAAAVLRAVLVPVVCLVGLTGSVVLAGCGSGGPPPGPAPSAVPVAGAAADPRAQLASRAAAAKDRRYSAAYTWSGTGVPRTVTVTKAADGSWRVDVPGGALGGQATVALVGRPDGVYQCALPGGCTRIAKAGAPLPAAYDPRVQHPFTDWLAVLTDRQAALSVTDAKQIAGAGGACYSVEPTTVALQSPIEPGIFCYDDGGLLTAVRSRFGTLMLSGTPAAAPATVALPGHVTSGPALPTAVPSPSPSSATATPRPSRR